MKIIAAASAYPANYYHQSTLLSVLRAYWGDQLEKPELRW